MSAGRPSSTSPRRWTGHSPPMAPTTSPRTTACRRIATRLPTARACQSSTSSSTASSLQARLTPRLRPRLQTRLTMRRSKRSCRSTIWRRSPTSSVQPRDRIGERHDREPQRERGHEPHGERHDREPQGERDDEIYDLPPLDEVMADENILAAAPSAVHEFRAMDPSPIDVPEETVVEDLAEPLTPAETAEETPEYSAHEESVEEAPVVAAAEPAGKKVEHPPLPTVDEPIAETVDVATAAVEPFVEPRATVAALRRFQPSSPNRRPNQTRTRRLRAGESASNRNPPARGRTSFARRRAVRRHRHRRRHRPSLRARRTQAGGWCRRSAPRSSNRPFQFISRLRRHRRHRCGRRRCPRSRRSCQRRSARCLTPSIRHQVVTRPAYGTSSAQSPATPGPLAPPQVQPAPQPSGQVKIKADPPSGFTPRRSAHQDVAPVHVPAERYGTLGLGRGDSTVERKSRGRSPGSSRRSRWPWPASRSSSVALTCPDGRQCLASRERRLKRQPRRHPAPPLRRQTPTHRSRRDEGDWSSRRNRQASRCCSIGSRLARRRSSSTCPRGGTSSRFRRWW